MRLQDLPLSERPRERLQEFGVSALSDAELLAVILRTGNRKENVVELAKRLLSQTSLPRLSGQSVAALRTNYSVGEAKACQVLASLELGRRMYRQKAVAQRVDSLRDVLRLVKPELVGKKQEHFLGLYLDNRNRVISWRTLFVGSLDATLIHPREVFSWALRELAAKVIVVHNHPSGDPTPSEADVRVTRRLFDAGVMLGIELVDHIVVGDNRACSVLGDG